MANRYAKTNKNDQVAVFCSRRFQDGVEIVEREVHVVTTVDVPLEQPVKPRLVITDALASAAELLLAKTRSEVIGLSSFLNSLHPVRSK